MVRTVIFLCFCTVVVLMPVGVNAARKGKKPVFNRCESSKPRLSYRCFKKDLSEQLGGVPIRSLGFKEVRKVYRQMLKGPIQDNQQNRAGMVSFLSSICALCRRTGNQSCINIYCFRK